MKTAVPMCPTVDELEKLPAPALEQMLQLSRLAIAKPYFAERLELALILKTGGDK